MPELPTVHRLRMLQDVLADILSRPLICSHCGKELDEEWLSDPGPAWSDHKTAPVTRGVNQVDSRAYRDPVQEKYGGTYAPGAGPARSRRSRYRPPE